MKANLLLPLALACAIVVQPSVVTAAASATPYIYETPLEFFGSTDFDADGRADVVIVDKESGKFRLGYQQSSGLFSNPSSED